LITVRGANAVVAIDFERITMNYSFFTCDRATHLKIVVVALVAGIVVMVAGIHARTSDTSGVTANAKTNGVVVKAGKPAVLSTRDDAAIR
jgi:hypothetical protein